jgi:hypothetical protein
MKLLFGPVRDSFDRQEVNTLGKDLEELAKFIEGSGLEVYLVGGVAVALTVGDFYRNHHDFDLALFVKDLDKFHQFLRSMNYLLVKRHFSANVSPGHRIYCVSETTPDRVHEKNQSRLRLLRQNRKRIHYLPNRMDYIDLFLLDEHENYIHLLEHGQFVPKNEFYPIATHLTNKGKIFIPNIKYRERIECIDIKQVDDLTRAGLIPK